MIVKHTTYKRKTLYKNKPLITYKTHELAEEPFSPLEEERRFIWGDDYRDIFDHMFYEGELIFVDKRNYIQRLFDRDYSWLVAFMYALLLFGSIILFALIYNDKI